MKIEKRSAIVSLLGATVLAALGGLVMGAMISSANAEGAAMAASELQTVRKVDVKRYLGRWYEIASIPAWFQKDCAGGTTATYSLNGDGAVKVVNKCFTAEKKPKAVTGVAWVVDTATNAKLKVSFLPFGLKIFGGDYWIIDLDPEYRFAVVGTPGRDYGWILSRTPSLPPTALAGIQTRLAAQGYNFSAFRLTNQKDYLSLQAQP